MCTPKLRSICFANNSSCNGTRTSSSTSRHWCYCTTSIDGCSCEHRRAYDVRSHGHLDIHADANLLHSHGVHATGVHASHHHHALGVYAHGGTCSQRRIFPAACPPLHHRGCNANARANVWRHAARDLRWPAAAPSRYASTATARAYSNNKWRNR